MESSAEHETFRTRATRTEYDWFDSAARPTGTCNQINKHGLGGQNINFFADVLTQKKILNFKCDVN